MTDSEEAEEQAPAAVADDTGAAIVNASFAGTALVVAAGAAGAAAPDTFAGPTVVVSVVLFGIGVAGLLYGYGVGVARSRDDDITLGGLFWLSGTAPKVVRFRLRLAFIAQIVVAFAASAVRIYSPVAFISLAPMFGLGMLAVWGARHGTFFPKQR